jgi:PBP1b-binding outer membrane lipoprotein LpoB
MKKILLVLALVVVVASCKKEDVAPNTECTSLKAIKHQVFLNNKWYYTGPVDTIGYSVCSDTTDWEQYNNGSYLMRKAKKKI